MPFTQANGEARLVTILIASPSESHSSVSRAVYPGNVTRTIIPCFAGTGACKEEERL